MGRSRSPQVTLRKSHSWKCSPGGHRPVQVQLVVAYLNNLQVLMEEPKKIIKNTEEFEPHRFLPFERDMRERRVKVRPENVTEISLRCCGYGYFEDSQLHFQTQMKENFLAYLRESIAKCPSIRTLKIEFNGFSIQKKFLRLILEEVTGLIKRKSSVGDRGGQGERNKARFDAIWIHTRMLKGCDVSSAEDMLTLVDEMIKENICEEISIQMSGWEFSSDISYEKFREIFERFAEGLVSMQESPLKRVKLDLSSWYTHNLEAYQFLSRSLEHSKITSEVFSSQPEDVRTEDETRQLKDIFSRYLPGIDDRYRIQNPIPGRRHIILSREGEFNKRRYAYIQEQISKGTANREELLNILDQVPLFGGGEHARRAKEIAQKIDEEIKRQQQAEKEDAKAVQTVNENEKIINDRCLKFPFDFVMALRVKQFHLLFVQFIRKIQEELAHIDEFQIDMRNWNGLFQMGDLKKMLQKEFAQQGVMRLLSNAFSKVIPRSEQAAIANAEGSKLKCTFLM